MRANSIAASAGARAAGGDEAVLLVGTAAVPSAPRELPAGGGSGWFARHPSGGCVAETGEAVLQRMAEPRALWASWARVAAGSRLPGVDGVSPADYAAGLPHQLDVLGRELVGGAYRPLPLRPLTVAGRGKRRRLGVPCVRDRIAQRAFLEVCGTRLQAGEAEARFAYRRGRCWIDALQRAAEHRDAGRRSVARSDVRRFFDSVDHGLLTVERAALFEPPVVDLLVSWAAAPVSVGGVNRERTRGLPQGLRSVRPWRTSTCARWTARSTVAVVASCGTRMTSRCSAWTTGTPSSPRRR